MVEFLKANWVEIVILFTIGSALASYNYRFRRNTERHDEHDDWKKNHENKCELRYKEMLNEFKEMRKEQNKSMGEMHEKINSVAIEVAKK